MKNYIFLLVVFSFILENTTGQSLINNGSFEDFSKCPKYNGQLNRAKEWRNPLKITPDYFHSCSNRVPENRMGLQTPNTGEGYIGFILQVYKLYRRSKDTTRAFGYTELTQTKLKRSLKKRELLCVKFYISQAEVSEFSLNQIPVIFSENKKLYKTIKRYGSKGYVFNGHEIGCTNSDAFLTDKENWTEICGVYKAAGNERFLTIGTTESLPFQQNIMPKKRKYHSRGGPYSYYYIDDISLLPVSDSSECKCGRKQAVIPNQVKTIDTIRNTIVERVDMLKVGKVNTPTVVIENTIISIESPMILKNIQFEFNRAILLHQKLEELDKLALYLIDNKKVIVEIGGHTDNVGDEGYNLKLSQKRAERIQQYLTKKGVSIHQLKAKGYGETQPIDNNKTKSGRKNNRRVEVKIIEG